MNLLRLRTPTSVAASRPAGALGRRLRSPRALAGLLLLGALPRCSCEEGGITQALAEMNLVLIETDPCSMAVIPRRIPDDYDRLMSAQVTDMGSRAEKVFEVRSQGTAPLRVSEVSLSEADPEFTLTVTDAAGNPLTLPAEFPARAEQNAPAAMVIKVAYASADAEPDLVKLRVKTDDKKRSDIEFGLAAGRGRIEVAICDGANCTTTSSVVAFGNVSRGGSATRKLVIKNVGEGDLDLRDVKIDSSSAEFCAPQATVNPEGATCQPLSLCRTLRPGETYDVELTYTPVDGNTDSGIVRITSGDAARGTVEIPFGGVGAGPALCACVVENGNCVDATTIDFGAVGVGATERRTVRIRSCGTETANLTEAILETMAGPFRTGPEFSVTQPFSPGMLAPGQQTEGEITYAPTAAGNHTGGLRFTLAPSTTSWIALRGRAATCDLEALPLQVAFGTVASGSPAERNVLLVNNGARACQVLTITDPANGFTLPNKPTLPTTVAAGQSLTLTVRYTAPARQTPSPDMSSFVVTSDEVGAGASQTIELTATGGGMPVCNVDVQPTGNSLAMNRDGQLNFGATNVGFRKTLPIRIRNTGNTNCTLQSFMLRSANASQFMVTTARALPLTIAPGTTDNIDVTFAPTALTTTPLGFTPIFNNVDFVLAGPGLMKPNWSIGISARATLPSIDIIPDEVDFGVITWDRPRAPDNRSSCGSETRSVRIYNTGTGALNVTSIEIEAGSDPTFLITGVTNNGAAVQPPYAMVINAGQNAEVSLRFFPTRTNPGQHRGLLVVNNDQTMQSTVPLRGEGTANARQTDTFSQLTDNKVDILWVVDDSGSMSEEQNSLAQNFNSFISYADTLGVDYQVGVITTEINDPVSGKIWACNNFNKIIRSSDANRVQAFQCAANVTTPPGGNRRPNPGGSDEAEAGLRAARIALEPPVIGTDNAGFLRNDARLAVIIVSDEEDQSPGPVSLYVDFFRNVKGFRNPQLVSVSAIAGDVPNGCATAEGGNRYADAVGQLNGQFESICSSSWANLLQRIGLGVFSLRSAWSLSRAADPATVQVTVNGSPVSQGGSNGWVFDTSSNTVEFRGTSVPPPGASVTVSYGAICLP